MQYSPASEADKSYFQDLHQQCYRDVVTRQFGSWESKVQRLTFNARWSAQQFTKIIIDGQVVGGIWIDEHDEYRQVREIQIHPTYQGQGIGTRVMQDVIDRTQQMVRKLMLKVLHENLELGLYTSGLDLSSKTILWFNTLWNIAARLEIRSLVSLVRSMSPVS